MFIIIYYYVRHIFLSELNIRIAIINLFIVIIIIIMMKRQQVDFLCGSARCLRARAGELKVGPGKMCAPVSGACGDQMHLCMHVSAVDT